MEKANAIADVKKEISIIEELKNYVEDKEFFLVKKELIEDVFENEEKELLVKELEPTIKEFKSLLLSVKSFFNGEKAYDIVVSEEVKQFINGLMLTNEFVFTNMEELFKDLYVSKDIESPEKLKKLIKFISYLYNFSYTRKNKNGLAELCGESLKVLIKLYIYENSNEIEGLTVNNFNNMPDVIDVIVGLIKLNKASEKETKQNFFKNCFLGCFKK
jgi:hypothetical protein